MKKSETINTFDLGMIMDLNPLVTPNNTVTNCLNGTLLTYNGNENVLLNDMGNGRVETACLPEGYVPLGTTEFGGIIYIVSYNPLIDKCLIGCFPSPERNISTDKLEDSEKELIIKDFYINEEEKLIGSPYKKLLLTDKILHPGDKFLIYCELLENIDNTYISALKAGNSNADLYPRYLKFNVVAILDNGLINNLNNTLVWNPSNNYYILGEKIEMTNGKLSLDEYRDLIHSNYNAFNSKVDGKLAILALLECIDTFSVSWDAIKENGQWKFYFFLNWSYNNDISKDKINLHNIKVVRKINDEEESTILDIINYPSSRYSDDIKETKGTDIIEDENTTFYTPYYIDTILLPNYKENGGIKLPRKNDGSDNLYLLYNPFVLPENTKGIVDFTIYPGMPFGFLDYLKTSFSVDIEKLGSGEIALKEYRYWYDPNNITINWALEAYPEKNKQIKEVNFNFYKFGLNIKSWIDNCGGSTIDDDRVIKLSSGNSNGAWENTENAEKPVSPTNGIPSLKYAVSNQSSYSGHFTENIVGLEENQLYLVEMEINYNDEKTIKYYRFLYTSNIFNNYYFSPDIKSDYKNIELQDAFEKYHPITHGISNMKLTNVAKDLILRNETGTVVDTIPKYVHTDLKNKYIVTGNYKCNIVFDLLSRNDNKLFDTSLSNIIIKDSSGTNNIITNTTHNGEKQLLLQLLGSSGVSDLGEISYNSNLEGRFLEKKFIGSFGLTLKTPFNVDYSFQLDIIVPYSLIKLDVDDAWLLIDGGERNITIYVSDKYESYNSLVDKTGASNWYGDDSHFFSSLDYYSNVYNTIKEKLELHDIIALKFRTWHGAEQGNEGNWTSWGSGIWHGGDSSSFDKNIFYWTRDTNQEGAALPIYAMLNTDDLVVLFTFSKLYNPISTTTWYGKTTVKAHSSNWTNKPPIALRTDSIGDVIKTPFRDYYKLEKLDNSKREYFWSIVDYYNNYMWNTSFNIPCKGNIVIKINECVIPTNNYPRNLKYTPSTSFTINGNISDILTFDRYTNMLLSDSSNTALVKRGNNEYIEIMDINPKNIYDWNGLVISNLKRDRGLSIDVPSKLEGSSYEIKNIDGRLKMVKTNILTSENISVMGREEEQNLAISNIIKL